jgi:hypothetical protein
LSADAKVPPDERAHLRRQAHMWMTATQAADRTQLQRDRAGYRQDVYRHLSQWLNDSDFVSVRDRPALDSLPVDERVGWVKLWTEIRELHAATAPPPAAPPPREVKR